LQVFHPVVHEAGDDQKVRPSTSSAVDPENIGLEEIGDSTGAESERSKIFAV
jgi:hypothetical protein